MQLTQLQADTALLDYSLSTAPSPVQVSESATRPSPAPLTFVSRTADPDDVTQQGRLPAPRRKPQGAEGADLTEDTAGTIII